MADVVGGLVDALADAGQFDLVSGRHLDGLSALVDAAANHVMSPGPTTRLHVAAGLGRGGHRVAVVLEQFPPGPAPDSGVVAVTMSPACARGALAAGWSVAQPWSGDDVPALLDAADGPVIVLLGGTPGLAFDDPPAPRRTRLWIDGDLATIVASGTAVPPAVRLAERLQTRGVDVAAVEVAILTARDQAPLVGGESLLVAGRDTVSAFRGQTWPSVPTSEVALAGREEADLIGEVLAVVPTG